MEKAMQLKNPTKESSRGTFSETSSEEEEVLLSIILWKGETLKYVTITTQHLLAAPGQQVFY